MCKGTEHKKGKNNSVTWVFIVISIVFTLTMTFLVLWPIFYSSNNVRKVEICLRIPNDSLSIDKVLLKNNYQIKTLVEELNRQSQEITNNYNLLIKSQEIKTDFFRLVSCIAAFVVALLGFLGYRTIRDIELKAAALAEDKADKTAKKYVKDQLASEVEKRLKDIVEDTTAARLLCEQIKKDIMPLITPLEERINELESNKPEIGKERIEEAEMTKKMFAHTNLEEIAQITTREINNKEGEK